MSSPLGNHTKPNDPDRHLIVAICNTKSGTERHHGVRLNACSVWLFFPKGPNLDNPWVRVQLLWRLISFNLCLSGFCGPNNWHISASCKGLRLYMTHYHSIHNTCAHSWRNQFSTLRHVAVENTNCSSFFPIHFHEIRNQEHIVKWTTHVEILPLLCSIICCWLCHVPPLDAPPSPDNLWPSFRRKLVGVRMGAPNSPVSHQGNIVDFWNVISFNYPFIRIPIL